jgi:MFS family permease
MRGLGSRVLVVVACGVMLLALVVGYVRHTVVNSDQFANRASAALGDESVRTLIAERITDQVVLARESDLLAARPIIESVASDIVGSRAFTGLFRKAVRDLHRAVFARDRNTVTLTIADVGTVLAAALEKLRPGLARHVQAADRVALLQRNLGDLGTTGTDVARRARVLAIVLPLLAAALAAAAVALSVDRRRTVVALAVGAAVAGVLLVVAYGVLRALVADQVDGPDEQAAARAVWDAFLGDLRTAGWILAGSGAVVAAAAASLIRPIDVGEPLRRATAWVLKEPERPALRVVRGAAFVAAGLIVLLARDAVLQVVLTVAGVYLIYEGLATVLRLIYRPGEADVDIDVPAVRHPRRIVAMAIPVLLILLVVGVFLGTGGTSTAAPAAGPCNGHVELCDRPLDRVALAATHNSMSVPLPGWFSSIQDAPIGDQLRDGVRGLLIDTHYADRLSNDRLRTVIGENVRKFREDGVSQDSLDAALRIRDRLGFAGRGTRGMYLCHTFCELGGTRLQSALDDLHTFLVANPGEVVVVINQDYVTPADFVGAVKDAGLDKLAYRGPVDGKWPTLREMIDSGQRVLFMAENHAGAADWYHPVYKAITQETPFSFSRVAQLKDAAKLPATCRPNRGPASAPLFLVNHWITTDPVPRPSNAAVVNAYAPLLARVRACEEIRGHFPNLVAVDFYRRGDLFRVVDPRTRVSTTH